MKAATTATQRRIETHPTVGTVRLQEPNFFCDDSKWALGSDWYLSLFERSAVRTIVGEASVNYTDPARSGVAAERMHSLAPDIRLIFLARHPIERMRSEYRHQVQRGRERRTFDRVLSEQPDLYSARSRYYEALRPYLDRFPNAQLHIARTDDIATRPGWDELLRFLSLTTVDLPPIDENATESKKAFTRPMLWLFDRGITGSPKWIPSPLRAVTGRLLTRDDDPYRRLIESSRGDVPIDLETELWADLTRLEHTRQIPPLWPR
jgi:hypothetical protein